MKKFFIASWIVLFIAGAAYAFSPVVVGVGLPGANDFLPFAGSHRVNKTSCVYCNGTGKIIKTKVVWSKLKKRLVKARQSAVCPKCSGQGFVPLKESF